MPPALVRTDLLDDLSLRGPAFASAWTDRLEQWLVELFDEAVGSEADLALLALGGQGRREMAPQSDLDLLLLFRSGDAPEEPAQKLWYPIWDADLKLGHAVRTVADTLSLASEDLETATSLLSARHICGDTDLSAELNERARTNWRRKGRRWLQELARATDERHRNASEVAFSLEPDLKEGRGGLRDVHALGWAVAAGAPIEAHLTDDLREDHDVLLEARVELHRLQGRAGDRLLLQEQDSVAAQLGDPDADALMARVAAAGRAIAFASDEAWHDIRADLDSSLFRRFRRNRRLGESIEVRNARVTLHDESAPVEDPFEVLRVGIAAAREGVRISRATLDALESAPEPPPVWPSSARADLCSLLLTGAPAVEAIEILNSRELWTRLIPEWAPTVSRPQRNAYHRFTVDRHLLETAAEAARLAHLVPRSDLLVVGALLHDIGKGYPQRGDHSVVGSQIARVIATRMGFESADVDIIESIVLQHLLLPDVATRRNVEDRATWEFFADEVGSAENVALLRALTEADSIATGPAAWSPWKAELVERLASRTIDFLSGVDLELDERESFPTEDQRELLDSDGVKVADEGDRITIACEDRPGVFFGVAGALALHGLDVTEANIYSEGGRVLDEFRVRSGPSGVVPWDRVRKDVIKALEGRIALQARIEERARAHTRRHHPGVHQFDPTVRFDNGSSAETTVIEVVGPDSIGLLYRLARCLAEFNLDVTGARIHTMGHDVTDSFYVRRADGGRVSDAELQGEISRALLNALDAPR